MNKFIQYCICILVLFTYIYVVEIFWQTYSYAIINLTLVFLLAVFYSFVELMNNFSVRSIYKTKWGLIYLVLNGLLGVMALIFTFKDEFNTTFLGAKILVAGTSALALLRVISVPVKQNGVENKVSSMIEIILAKVQREYKRERLNIDVKELKRIMNGIDYKKAAENIPILAGSLQTLDPNEAADFKIEVQKALTLEEGKETKHITIGSILARFIGTNALENIIDEIKDYISVDAANPQNENHDSDRELDELIEKYS